jgi:hypothetical protein
MPQELTGERLFDFLLRRDEYDVVIEKFNTLTHNEKFEALADAYFRGYLYRATQSRGSITAGRTT